MALIAHISDPHLGPLPSVAPADLFSKRIFGYLNWKRNRGRIYDNAVVDALTADIRAVGADHIAVTGDLVNLALSAEFDNAREWLDTLGAPEDVTIVPGNHDAYVPGAIDVLGRSWRSFMDGERPGGGTFPFIRRRRTFALIGVSTAVATPPLIATGRVGVAQAAALGQALAETGGEGLPRIVLIHHPPVAGLTRWHRRLSDAHRVADAIAKHGAELVLHGHSHRTSRRSLGGPRGPVPVVGAAAASLRPTAVRPGGGYNLIAIDGAAGAATITVTERRVTATGTVETAAEVKLVG